MALLSFESCPLSRAKASRLFPHLNRMPRTHPAETENSGSTSPENIIWPFMPNYWLQMLLGTLPKIDRRTPSASAAAVSGL